MGWRVAFALSFLVISCTLAEGWSEKVPLPRAQKIVVVVCDGLTLQSLVRMGEPVTTLIRNGAVGLLSGSSLELSGRKGVFVTLGSGRRARANERAELGKWLRQRGKNFRLYGDGILEAIVGEKAAVTSKPDREPDLVFIAASKSSLPLTLKNLTERLDENSCLWLVVPNSPQTGWQNRRLTPILVSGKGVPSGLLTSQTTRKIGLVSSVDFAPTLLAQLGIPKPAAVTGSEMRVVRKPIDRLAYLLWLDERGIRPLKDLPALAVAISAVTILALSLAAVSVLFSLRPNGFLSTAALQAINRSAVFAIVAGMSIPASLFIVTYLPHRTGVVNALQLLALASAFAGLSLKLSSALDKALPSGFPVSLRAAGLVCALTAAIALLGVPLYWATPLGHYPTTGWRYFGITNAGVGLILAGTIFAWKLLPLPNRFPLLWLISSPFLVGFSLWGANFGGALTLAVGFAAAWLWVGAGVFSWRRAVGSSLLAVALTVIALSVAEGFVPSEQKAHWGQLLQRVELLGFAAFVEMVARKISLLWEFFARTPLNFLALSLFVGFQVAVPLLSRRSPLLSELKPAFAAVFVGSWAGFFLNDSGMEVVGMAMVVFGGVFLLALLESFRSVVKG